jgi:hypothetical protein
MADELKVTRKLYSKEWDTLSLALFWIRRCRGIHVHKLPVVDFATTQVAEDIPILLSFLAFIQGDVAKYPKR